MRAETRPLVGAIRWDVWVKWPAGARQSRYHSHLQPKQWRHRLPFYARFLSDTSVQIESDTQEIMDKEIEYAAGAGLDYWAFDWYHPNFTSVPDNLNRCLKLYLSSRRKKEIGFCLTLLGYGLGPKAEWETTADELVKLFKEDSYLKLGKRPLLFIFNAEQMEKYFAPWQDSRKALDRLRQKTIEAGLDSPYIVAMILWGSENQEFLGVLGFDALSAYSAVNGTGEHEELPYRELCDMNRDFWDTCKAAGKKVIPTVNAGWDGRPILLDEKDGANYQGPWFAPAKPKELADHLAGSFNWLKKNRETAEANCVLIYAWNEISEGGWLVPTLSEGAARLEAIGQMLKEKNRR